MQNSFFVIGLKCMTNELTFGFGKKQFGETTNLFKNFSLKFAKIEILP